MLIDNGISKGAARDATDIYDRLELPAAKSVESSSNAQYPKDKCFTVKTDDEDLLMVFDDNDTLIIIYSEENDVNYYIDILSQGDGFDSDVSSE